MAITITDQGESPGKGRSSPIRFGGAGRAPIMRIYTVDWDDSYATGGEDISSIWNDFKAVLGIFVQPAENTIAANRMFAVDLTNKKLIMLSAINTEASGDQSSVDATQLLVIGY